MVDMGILKTAKYVWQHDTAILYPLWFLTRGREPAFRTMRRIPHNRNFSLSVLNLAKKLPRLTVKPA